MKNKIFNIVDFGAIANITELQTEKIQAAIDKCFEHGGGEVVVPEGIFYTGGIRIRSNVTLHLLENAVIKGSKNPEDYFGYINDKTEPLPNELITDAEWKRAEILENKDDNYRFFRIAGSRWNNALIRGIDAENITIRGERGSIIDGSDCFDENGEEYYRGPHCIGLFYCKNITFEGYTIKDSANWAHSVFYSENLVVNNITVLAGHDGIHLNSCKNVTVENCHFYTGDDCVAGFANLNVLVRKCELNSACSALRFGGTNVLVEKCHIYGPCKYLFRGSLTDEEKRNGIHPELEGHRKNMLSVFTYFSDFSIPVEYQPGNIIIKDCRVDYADRFLHYNYSGNEMWQTNMPLESVRFENITATDISMPLTAYGDKDIPITVELKNIDLSIRRGSENIDFMHIANYKKVALENIKIKGHKGNIIKAWTDGNVEISQIECNTPKSKYLVHADEKFECTPI